MVPASGPAPAEFTVAYEDDGLIVVDKPAGVVVHPARGHEDGTLAQALADRAAGGDDPYRAGIVHRLDRDTSGLLVIAKSDAVHRALKDLLQARLLQSGVPDPGRRHSARAHGDDRRADRARSPRAAVCTRSTRMPRVRRAPTSSCSSRCDTRHCCGSRSRPGGPTRSACICRRSGTRCSATPPMAARCGSGWTASSCTRRGSRSRIRSRATRSTSARRCRRISRRPLSSRELKRPDLLHLATFPKTNPPRAVRSRPASGYARSRDKTSDQRWSFSTIHQGSYEWLK